MEFGCLLLVIVRLFVDDFGVSLDRIGRGGLVNLSKVY